jgi:hypothetical protein
VQHRNLAEEFVSQQRQILARPSLLRLAHSFQTLTKNPSAVAARVHSKAEGEHAHGKCNEKG